MLHLHTIFRCLIVFAMCILVPQQVLAQPAPELVGEATTELTRTPVEATSVPTTEPATAPSTVPATLPTTAPVAPPPPASESPIPFAEVADRAESVSASLQRVDDTLSSTRVTSSIGNQLPNLVREIDARQEETTRITSAAPSIDVLRSLEQSWEGLARSLESWRATLTRRATQLDSQTRQLRELSSTWRQTLETARANNTPDEVTQRIEGVATRIDNTLQAVEDRRAEVLTIQNRVAEQTARAGDAIEQVERARSAALGRIFDQDAAPIWSGQATPRPGDGLLRDGRESFTSQMTALRAYGSRQRARFFIHAVIFVLLAIALRWAAPRVDAWAKTEPNLKRTALIFNAPIATAALLAAIASGWIYPQAPRLLWSIVGAAALLPAVVVLRKLLEPRLFAVLNALVVLYFADQTRRVLASHPVLARWLFILEMIGGAVFIVWFVRSGRLNTVLKTKTDRSALLTRVLAKGAFILFAVAFLANVFGFVALSDLLGHATLGSTYVGVTFYALTRVLDGLIMVVLRAYPAATLRAVREHRQLVWQRLRWVVHLAVFALWALITLELFSIRGPVLNFFGDLLSARFRIGSIRFSPGNLLAFIFTVWASFLISRFARFLLAEDVYPRFHFRRGLPYAISTLLHYAILVAGFILAIAAMGYDMTKFTILAGAFGVGLGFGMQNIVNNFVSGLILLFERPIQVGDTIEIDNVVGTISRIGIRASIIRTVNGSSVIYPNATLISNRVTNWTLSSRKRRIDIPVAVVLGSDPRKVIDLMRGVAEQHALIEKTPEPEAVLINIAPGALNFELRAWTESPEKWVEIRSDLAIGVNDALVQNGIGIK